MEMMAYLNMEQSTLSKERIKFMIEQFKKLSKKYGDDTVITMDQYRWLLTAFSEQYSALIKEHLGRETNDGELLIYDMVEGPETIGEAYDEMGEPYKEVIQMVNIEKYKAKDFTETRTVTASDKPDSPAIIKRVDEVTIKSGPRAGSTGIVIELEPDWTYWPNKTSIKNIAEKFGNETEKWIGKKIKLSTEKMIVQGKKQEVIFAEPA